MTTFYARREGFALHPDGDESITEFAKIPIGKPVKVEVTRSRNIRFHRLYFALCARIAHAIGAETSNISDFFKISTGHTLKIRTKSYGVVEVPKSISFAAMSEDEFKAYFERCVEVAYNSWKIDPATIADLLVRG